jgi:hypothetical protein
MFILTGAFVGFYNLVMTLRKGELFAPELLEDEAV